MALRNRELHARNDDDEMISFQCRTCSSAYENNVLCGFDQKYTVFFC